MYGFIIGEVIDFEARLLAYGCMDRIEGRYLLPIFVLSLIDKLHAVGLLHVTRKLGFLDWGDEFGQGKKSIILIIQKNTVPLPLSSWGTFLYDIFIAITKGNVLP